MSAASDVLEPVLFVSVCSAEASDFSRAILACSGTSTVARADDADEVRLPAASFLVARAFQGAT
jgi:hypothetical protein